MIDLLLAARKPVSDQQQESFGLAEEKLLCCLLKKDRTGALMNSTKRHTSQLTSNSFRQPIHSISSYTFCEEDDPSFFNRLNSRVAASPFWKLPPASHNNLL